MGKSGITLSRGLTSVPQKKSQWSRGFGKQSASEPKSIDQVEIIQPRALGESRIAEEVYEEEDLEHSSSEISLSSRPAESAASRNNYISNV